jgi:hypothetical protein
VDVAALQRVDRRRVAANRAAGDEAAHRVVPAEAPVPVDAAGVSVIGQEFGRASTCRFVDVAMKPSDDWFANSRRARMTEYPANGSMFCFVRERPVRDDRVLLRGQRGERADREPPNRPSASPRRGSWSAAASRVAPFGKIGRPAR